MLVESLIRKTLGIKSHVIKTIEETDEGLMVTLDLYRRRRLPCSRCGTPGKVRDRLKPRTWKHVPLWGIPVKLRYAPARVKCAVCGKVLVEAIPWSQGKCRSTTGLIWLLSALCKLLPWKQVAELYTVHWNTVAAAVRQAVAWGLAHRDMSHIEEIGVDELSRRKGHVYVTNVYDLKEKNLLWSGEEREKETLDAFVREHGKALKQTVKGICCDMWQPYINRLKKHFPKATLVFDRFHILQQLSRAIDLVRAEEAREQKKTNPELLKRSRYLFLKNPERLTDKQRARLGHLEKMNLRTFRAWLLKESFRELYHCQTKKEGRKFLKKWFWWATHSRLKPMRDFAWTIRNHEEEVLNFLERPINNGVVEGLNNKAKVVSHRCYGFRTAETYIIALYHCLGNLPEPEMVHRFL